jgi:hypothetical protein
MASARIEEGTLPAAFRKADWLIPNKLFFHGAIL